MFRCRAFVLFALLLLAAPTAVRAEAPSNLAGVTLGDTAKSYRGRLTIARERPVKNAPWVRRIPLRPDKYFASGYVLVGTCAAPGRVARIKARYRDGNLDFFRRISGDLLARYGDPTEYKGELDGRIMGNKWGFTDPWTRPVSLIVQHVEGEDPETGAGNTIKLTNWGLLEAERACWQERHPAPTRKKKATGKDHGYIPR
ncbi:conserved hypothetical protein [Solidesulfovibrio fructosivorans JJ]]|uniref:Uncharacterized protein n=1 Tax=Solidesulfovibrio fructosivorans JJ] TaxID=596151 RepID=E1K077_SOLFR|nr:hypothetical protein [Solidesulfovibrio fructosivorans]EFL49995.1 conserved hypothetical protein [Solidesulfovibrio fructosivorans JJ]]